ncbi:MULTISPECIES: phosphatidylglycerol lysyltransferase domain-containing protein [Pseudooceanicola]|nr:MULTISPECIES: phosphatidylglycerol lysyltransferase domain-containing protein [Pseudooceanicola]
MAIAGRKGPAKAWLRYALPLGIGGLCLWLLTGRLSGLDPALIWEAFRAVRPGQWLAAIAATAISFWALGRYDAVIHRHLRTGIGPLEAQVSGASAIALAQLLGLGVLTGALVRWRLLPVLGPLRAAQVTAAVSVSFLISWALITALACLVLAPHLLPGWMLLSALAGVFLLPALALFLPELRLARWRFRLPSLHAMAAISLFAALDTAAAGAAMYALLPAPPPFPTFLPVFLLALGAGLFGGTPGGVGPFELTLLALLPALPEPELLAAVLAFRLVYYALPALAAAPQLLRPRERATDARAHVPRRVPELLLLHAPRSESGVARQNGARLLGETRNGALCIDTPQTLTLLFDPLTGPLDTLLPRLHRAARASNRLAVVYKCSPRQAILARRAGWKLARVADEAVIDAAGFQIDTPRHRQLRRKLRHAEKAGIRIRRPLDLPLADMARLDSAWKDSHGLARGLSTGRFAPSYVARQRVYCAEQDSQLVAFVTFHANTREYCLDLMRHGPDLPDGTMHALVVAAIHDAAAEGVPLSLAAMPAREVREHPRLARLRARIARSSGGDGLCRFKDSFAPRRQPLYMAAPSPAALVLAAVDLALAMRRPAGAGDPLSTGDEAS